MVIRCRARLLWPGVRRLRDWIVPAGPKRVTPHDATRREPAPPYRTVLLECFDRIGRAARHVATARREHGRECHLISANQQNEKRTHGFNLVPRASARFSLLRDRCAGPVRRARRSEGDMPRVAHGSPCRPPASPGGSPFARAREVAASGDSARPTTFHVSARRSRHADDRDAKGKRSPERRDVRCEGASLFVRSHEAQGHV